MATLVTPDNQEIQVPDETPVATAPATQFMLDTNNVPQVVDPDSVKTALDQGWQITDQAGADHAKAVIAAGQGIKPILAGVTGALKALPFSSILEREAALETQAITGQTPEQTLQHQALLAEGNPTATAIGNLGGTALGIGAFSGLGKAAASGVEAAGTVAQGLGAEAVPLLAKAAQGATTFGAYGAIKNLDEQALGNKDFNAEAMLAAGAQSAILGAVAEPLFGAVATVLPKVVRAGADAVTKLTDASSDALSSIYGKMPAPPSSLEEGIGEAANKNAAKEIYNTVANGGRITDVPQAVATKYADTLNDSIDKGYDLIKELNETLLPKQAKNLLGAQPESQIITGANDFLTQTLLPFSREMEASVKAGEFAPAMAKTIRRSILDLKAVAEDPDTVPSDLHQAFVKMRKTIDPVLKYGKSFAAGSTDGESAKTIEQGLQTPLRQFLKTPEVWGQPLATAHDAVMKAEHNFFTAASAVSKTVEGPELLPETPRPERSVKPAKILTMLRGEGTSLSQTERANVIKNFADKFGELQSAAEASAKHAGETIDEKTVPELLKAIHSQHEEGLATAKLGTRGKGWIQGGAQFVTPAALGLMGHPAAGAAVLAAKTALGVMDNPTNAMNVLGTIAKLANRHQAAIGKAAADFLKGVAKPIVSAAAINSSSKDFAGGTSRTTKGPDLAKRTDQIQNLMSNPTQLQNTLMRSTSGLVKIAPLHAAAIQQAALARLQVVSAALPQTQIQSFLPAPKYVPTPDEVAHFERVYSVVTQPVKATFAALNSGTFTPDMMMALKASAPATLKAIQDALQSEIMDNPGREYPYSQKVMLSMALEQPVSPELTSGQTMFQQAAYQTASAANPSVVPNTKTRVSGLNKLALSTETATPSEARSIDRNS